MNIKHSILALTVAFSAIFSGCAKKQPEVTSEREQIRPDRSTLRVSPDNADAAEPAVATARDGTSYVAWVEHGAEGKADVYIKPVGADGVDRGAPVRVNPEAGSATAWRGDPPTVAVSAYDGKIFVGWTARAAAEGHATNLYVSASSDSGKTFATSAKVNDDAKPGVHGMHSLAVDKNGRVYVGWLDERNLKPSAPMETHRGDMRKMESNRDVYAAYSEDGGRSFSKNLLIAHEACPCCKTAVTAGADGKVYVGWRQVLPGDFRHIAISASGDGGKTYSEGKIVSNDQWVIAGCPVSGPAMLADSKGVLSVLWYTAGGAGAQGLYLAQSRDTAQTFDTRRLISNGVVRGNPFLAPSADGSNMYAAWENNDGGNSQMMRARLGGDGNIIGNAVTINLGELPSASMEGEQMNLAYISRLKDKRSIWLTRPAPMAAPAPALQAQNSRADLPVSYFPGVGIITKINDEAGSIELDHDNIEGLMPAMRMEFYVTDKSLIGGLKVGDAVEFTIREQAHQEMISAIKKK